MHRRGCGARSRRASCVSTPMHAADPVVGAAVAEEGAVAAIVLDHEQAHEKPGRRNGEQEAHPPEAEHVGDPRRDPQCDQRQQRDEQLDDAALVARRAVAAEQLPDAPRIVRRGVRVMSEAQAEVRDGLVLRAGLAA